MGSVRSFRPQRPPLVAPGEIEHHVADLTVTAAADVTLAELQQKLGEQDQWLPIDGEPSQPVGKLIETNSTGPLRLGFGAWRDLLLGMQFTIGDGRLITAGGRAMKNVAGYDLTKFMVGQFGMLGQIVTITARTNKRPAAALLAKFDRSDKLIGELLPTSSRPQWAMLAEGFLWCGYLGDEKTITFQESELRSRRPVELGCVTETAASPSPCTQGEGWGEGQFQNPKSAIQNSKTLTLTLSLSTGRGDKSASRRFCPAPLELRRHSPQEDIDFRARRWLPPRPPIRYRASLPPAQVIQFTQPLPVGDYAADAAFGIVVGSCAPDRKDAMIAQARALGSGVIFDDPQEVASFFRAGGVERELLKRLQSAFDE